MTHFLSTAAKAHVTGGKKNLQLVYLATGMTGGFVEQIPASWVGRVFCLMPFDPMLIMYVCYMLSNAMLVSFRKRENSTYPEIEH